MIKVITYGSYDMLHNGHIRLLERAKELGDYLIVGVTSDDYDKSRGKINIQQSVMERINAVKATGIPDEVIIEEYEGQKIDDIKRLKVDIFTVGSDWAGVFDYLEAYCKVVYLPRSEGVSSTKIRSVRRNTTIRLVGEATIGDAFRAESEFVNGVDIVESPDASAVYLCTAPEKHYEQAYAALREGKHVLCESPVALSEQNCRELFSLAEKENRILMEGIKTAYSTAYARLVLLAKSGKIGSILSVDATCTSMKYLGHAQENQWNSLCGWGPIAMLPIFQILGTGYVKKNISSWMMREGYDGFTKIDFTYPHAVASVKVAKAAKSEGELIITGTEGYIYVPAPWWKTDYFEVRFENQNDNKRYFYQLDGTGVRYEIAAFIRALQNGCGDDCISRDISLAICRVLEDYYKGQGVTYL